MTTSPTLPAARQWWQRLSTRRRSLAIGGVAAVVLVGAGAASARGQSATEASPTTSTGVSRESFSPPTTAVPPATPSPSTTTASTVPLSTAPPSTLPVTYRVTEVIDGDTISVEPSDGSPGVRVRMVGIDAPESGECEADAATATLISFVLGREVVLTLDGGGEETDRYGRLLRYVDVEGMDAGLALIMQGFAVARYDSRDGYGAHAREATYVASDDGSPDYACPPPTAQAPPPPPPSPLPAAAPVPEAPTGGSNGCDPNYSGCVPIDSDVDCSSGSGNGPSYVDGPVHVIGTDVYGLDGTDNDGIGCE